MGYSYTMKKIIYIETPKGSFVKRNERQRVDFVSPIPCPFNYGHIKGEIGGDGDPLDVILLGDAVAAGVELSAELIGCVRFLDGGQQDDKWIAVQEGFPSRRERIQIGLFFQLYALAKRISAPLRGSSCQSAVLDIEYYK